MSAPYQGSKNDKGAVGYGDRVPYVDTATVQSVQNAFARSRLSHRGWTPRQAEGRVDGRNVWRNDARGATDIFRERHSPSTTKVNVWLLVDVSGSMAGKDYVRGARAMVPNPAFDPAREGNVGYYTQALVPDSLGKRVNRAQDCAATLVAAFSRISTVTLRVWSHSAYNSESGRGLKVHMRRWAEPGMPPTAMYGLAGAAGSGNADGFALKWFGDRALKAARPDERTVIVVISDGEPTEYDHSATNTNLIEFSANVSADLRSRGATVLSISIAGDPKGDSARMYGAENIVPFTGDWEKLGRELGTLFGQALKK